MIDPERVAIRVRIRNRGQAWDELDQTREISYTNLPPGHTVFEIQSSRDGRTWSTPALLEFEVIPRWHETLAFRSFAVGLFILVTWW